MTGEAFEKQFPVDINDYLIYLVPMKTFTPPVQKAVDYIKTNLKNGTWPIGQRLPTLQELAQAVCVRKEFMAQAIAVLEKEGLLKSRQKVGTFVGTELPTKPTTSNKEKKKNKPATIQENLQKEILEGQFHDADVLPSIKELAAHYETSYRIIRKVIDGLHYDGWIIPSRKSNRITIHRQSSPINSIYFLSGERTFTSIYLWSYERLRQESFIRSLEKDCSRKNIELLKMTYSLTTELQKASATILGFIVWYSWDIRESFIETLTQLARFNKPISIVNTMFDAHADAELLDQINNLNKKHRSIFSCNLNFDVQAGNKIGSFLLGKGHKRFCFFGYEPLRHEHFVLKRYNGMHKIFEGIDGSHFATYSPFIPPDPPKGPLLQSNDTLLEKEAAIFDQCINLLSENQSGPKSLSDRISIQIQEVQYIQQLQRIFNPIFEQAFNEVNAEVWICANDYIANFVALTFLKTRNVKIPRQIGLIGFDDQIESIMNNLTSYHFNFDTLALAMINAIIYPEMTKKRAEKTHGEIFELDGMVIDRGSV